MEGPTRIRTTGLCLLLRHGYISPALDIQATVRLAVRFTLDQPDMCHIQSQQPLNKVTQVSRFTPSPILQAGGLQTTLYGCLLVPLSQWTVTPFTARWPSASVNLHGWAEGVQS